MGGADVSADPGVHAVRGCRRSWLVDGKFPLGMRGLFGNHWGALSNFEPARLDWPTPAMRAPGLRAWGHLDLGTPGRSWRSPPSSERLLKTSSGRWPIRKRLCLDVFFSYLHIVHNVHKGWLTLMSPPPAAQSPAQYGALNNVTDWSTMLYNVYQCSRKFNNVHQCSTMFTNVHQCSTMFNNVTDCSAFSSFVGQSSGVVVLYLKQLPPYLQFLKSFSPCSFICVAISDGKTNYNEERQH